MRQMQQEVHELNEEMDKLRKENVMLMATVDEKINENLRLETKLQTISDERLLKTY